MIRHRAKRVLSFVGSTVLAGMLAGSAHAETSLRWTRAEDDRADLTHVIETINARTGYGLTADDFKLAEDRPLAFNHYRRYDQMQAGLPVKGMAIRVWTTQGKDELVQLEARVEAKATLANAVQKATYAVNDGNDAWADDLARNVLRSSEDAKLRSFEAENVWDVARGMSRTVRIVTAKARRGVHVIKIDLAMRRLIEHKYTPYPNADLRFGADEYAIPAEVYPVYEEFKGQMLARKRVELQHIAPIVSKASTDPYALLRDRRYFGRFEDQAKAETPEGRAAGYWSSRWLRRQADELRKQMPVVANDIGTGNAVLQGRYATINIHPDALTSFPLSGLPKSYSGQLNFSYKEDAANDDYEIVPRSAYLGKPLKDAQDALTRPATRDPQHDPNVYMHEGFDEVQVYFAVNELFETLRPLGFKDPDLGERPFHAFLYDPDIESRDNAYYTDDTINFTTYSPEAMNYARDNTTIWHELGHGVMDRLMGNQLALADTGGLSEGMADFVAQLVLYASYGDENFPGRSDMRIVNSTGFFFTNEVHDDGEAYGGAMNTILEAAIARDGRAGLHKVTDLVLEAMRLSRDHPALTAEAWFDHILFADQLGRPGVRRPGEMKELIEASLAARNFAPDADRARYGFSYEGKEVEAETPGSRGRDIKLSLKEGETSTHTLAVKLEDGKSFSFKYPVTVKVFFNSGPLQGAIDWVGEDQEPVVYMIAAPGETLKLPLTVNAKCDFINRTDGTCSDFAYVQLYNAGEDKPVAKKRFYLRITQAAN